MNFNENNEKFLTILLVEDDTNACQEIKDYVDTCDKVCLVGITNDSDQALTLLKDNIPDAVILDLELHYGSGNGLSFLMELSKLELAYRPYILVTTNNSSQLTYETARKFGADFIMSKHEENYSAKSVIDFLIMIFPTLLSMRKPAANAFHNAESLAEKKRRITKFISRELDLVGINRKNIGYQYLLDAILLFWEDPGVNAYSILGDKYHRNSTSIEHAIQYAIDRAWRTYPIEELEAHYTAKTHSCRGVPTITEFVLYYVDLINRNERAF